MNSLTVLIAISAALLFGKWNSPVEIQQVARLRILFYTAHFNIDL